MAAITELSIVNECIGTMGEAPLLELDEEHPFVAAALLALNSAIVFELHKFWWFNTDRITLTNANNSLFLYVPEDVVGVRIPNSSRLALRGRRVFDNYNGTYEIEGPLVVEVARDLPFEDMPVEAKQLIQARTVLRFQINYEASQSKIDQTSIFYKEAIALFNAENIRQAKVNMLNNSGTAQKLLQYGAYDRSGPRIPVR